MLRISQTRSFRTPAGRAAAWLLTAGLLLGPAGAPAHAAGPHDVAAQTLLRLTVEGGQTATLRCDPPGGTHPNAAAACSAVAAVSGDLELLPRRPDVFCPAVYDPVTVEAAGTWRGRPVNYRATFGNRCELGATTGAIFRF